MTRVGQIAEIRLGKMLQPSPSTATDTLVPYLRAGSLTDLGGGAELPLMYASAREIAAYRVQPGDLLVAEGGDVGRTAFAPSLESPTIIQNSLHRVRPRVGDVRFLRYALDVVKGSGWLDVLCNRSTFGHLTVEKLSAIEVPLPANELQRAIADYLDAETARIDAVTTKRKQMGRLLQERWQTTVRQTANNKQWPKVQLRRLWTVVDCKHLTPKYVEDGFPVISPGDVVPGRLALSRAHRFVDGTDFAALTDGLRRPVRGDVVYSRNASIGIAAYVDTDAPFTMGQDVCLIRSQSQDQLWLTHVLNSVGVDQLAVVKIGSTFDRVNISQLRELRIPAPSPVVQRTEASRIDEEGEALKRLLQALDHQVALLQERRRALITAAVSGALSVPGT